MGNAAAARINTNRDAKARRLAAQAGHLAARCDADVADVEALLLHGGATISRTGAWAALADLAGVGFPSGDTQALVLRYLERAQRITAQLPADPFAGFPKS